MFYDVIGVEWLDVFFFLFVDLIKLLMLNSSLILIQVITTLEGTFAWNGGF